MKTLIIAFAGVLLGACAREHLTPTHGRSYRAAFQGQVANPASQAKPPAGLDSQEASIISDGYRSSLGAPGEKVEEAPVLLVAPPQQTGRSRPPPPSVPKP